LEIIRIFRKNGEIMNDKITKISKRVGDYFAKKFKDGDNTLFTEISETAIDGFIEEIKKDNPVLAAWVSEWKDKNLKEVKAKKATTTYSGSCLDDDWMSDLGGGCYTTPKRKKSSGGCGISSSTSSGGCGVSSSSSSGGCGSSSSSSSGGCGSSSSRYNNSYGGC
jgi:hypothetical protein